MSQCAEMLREIRERVMRETGVPPTRIRASRGFRSQFVRERIEMFILPDPSELVSDDFVYCGIPVKCDLPTPLTTVVVEM